MDNADASRDAKLSGTTCLFFPKEIASPEELRHFVAEHAGAIAFIDASAMDVSLKLLVVDGHQPGDPTYPLR